jgi:serine/threonine-protein kinase
MGIVHWASDTKLDWDAALKIPPDAVAHNPDRLSRFEREAKVLASLNHPSIAQIWGVEDRALAMELVSGERLRGPLPPQMALNDAHQFAETLEAAREQGIVHRDLKPGEVMVTPEGVVKVLDFGLAAFGQDWTSSDAARANSPTLTMRATRDGTIAGAGTYMSPDQAAPQAKPRSPDHGSGPPTTKRMWPFRRSLSGGRPQAAGFHLGRSAGILAGGRK